MIVIDGSSGEGGGQIIRTSLALSVITGKPFRAVNIRAGRKKPGLQPQHLTSVRAAAQVGKARVEGGERDSLEITFQPTEIYTGNYSFRVGTAGSAMLVLQTVLPPLIIGDCPSRLSLEGGTHNHFAPPFEFLERSFLPLVNRMGPHVGIELRRHGFYPRGGGLVEVEVVPCKRLAPLSLDERGAVRSISATALVAGLPRHIAERELKVVADLMPEVPRRELRTVVVGDSPGPGNVLSIEIESDFVTEVFTGIGKRGLRAEDLAEGVVAEAKHYLESGAAAGTHLSDQLLLPLALAGGGSFTTCAISSHTRTNIAVISNFLDVGFAITEEAPNRYRLEAGSGY